MELSKRQAAWNAAASQEAARINPERAGRICWDSAAHLFNTGVDAIAAGAKLATVDPMRRPFS